MSDFAWSYSHLKNAETCLKRYYHYQVAKDVVEPESAQLLEGNLLHKVFEDRVKKNKPLPLGYTQHESLLAAIIRAPGETHAEQKLAIDADFNPVGYFARNVWLRSVLDITKVHNQAASTFDYKTGRPSDDTTQLKISAAMIFHHLPNVERVKAAFIFVNHNKIEREEFVRDDLTEIWSEILPRVKMLQKARDTQEYPPKPGGLCKKWCAVVSCPHHGRG